MQKYWVKVGQKVGGPFTSEKLQHLATRGKLKSAHLVSKDQKRWVSADKISRLSFPEVKTSSPSKSDEEADGPPASKPSASASHSKRASPPVSVGHRPVDGEKAPTVTEEEDSYLQFLTREAEAKKTSLRDVRNQLLSGELTRHHQTRWIEPRPKKSDYKVEIDSDVELDAELEESLEELKQMYREAVKDWKKRRKWRPIGEGLVEDFYRLRLLYRPVSVFKDFGTYLVGGTLFVAVLVMFAVMMFQQLMESEALESEGFNQLAEIMDSGNGFDSVVNQLQLQQMLKLSLPVLIPVLLSVGGAILGVAALIGLAGAYLIGAPAGWLLGTCVGPFLPTPPPDGYVEQKEPKT